MTRCKERRIRTDLGSAICIIYMLGWKKFCHLSIKSGPVSPVEEGKHVLDEKCCSTYFLVRWTVPCRRRNRGTGHKTLLELDFVTYWPPVTQFTILCVALKINQDVEMLSIVSGPKLCTSGIEPMAWCFSVLFVLLNTLRGLPSLLCMKLTAQLCMCVWPINLLRKHRGNYFFSVFTLSPYHLWEQGR